MFAPTVGIFVAVVVIIAPPIAGLLIANSYLTLFITDAVISTISAAIVFFALPETKPQAHENAQPESMKQTFIGYGRVFKDTRFLAFISVLVMSTLVYMNMNSTLGVYLRDEHGLPELRYGWLLSINAIMVVALQFWVTRRLEKYKPMLMMAVGALLYAIGFAMYGFIATFPLFIAAMVVITIGEMVISPVAQSLIAGFAPEDMRGRYMAVAGLSWSIAFTVGPYFAGLLLDSANPSLLWVISGFVGTLATLGFLVLNKVQHVPAPVIEPAAAN
jgi:MFS family permease